MSQKCPKCTKSVYAAEWVRVAEQYYHKGCLKCTTCDKSLTQNEAMDQKGQVYCKICFNKNFSSSGAGAKVAQPGSSGEGEKCPVCGKTVFQAEEIKTEVGKYHPGCFVCKECQVHLSLGKQKEKENSVYCEKCYNILFPVTGAGAKLAQPGSSGEGDKCPVCGNTVFQAEEIKTEIGKYHPGCFVCKECQVHLALGKQKEKENSVYCEKCYNLLFPVTGAGAKLAQPGSSGVGDKCPVCDKAVFQAEEIRTEFAKYHPACFVCKECQAHLVLGKQKEKENNVYCEKCYYALFPITGAGAKLAQPGESGVGDKCPVCDKAVFQAEEIKTVNAKYHPGCFFCKECKAALTLGKQKEKDTSVYCELCYNNLFRVGAVTGYTRGGAVSSVDGGEDVPI